jgi:hypothetical protein
MKRRIDKQKMVKVIVKKLIQPVIIILIRNPQKTVEIQVKLETFVTVVKMMKTSLLIPMMVEERRFLQQVPIQTIVKGVHFLKQVLVKGGGVYII